MTARARVPAFVGVLLALALTTGWRGEALAQPAPAAPAANPSLALIAEPSNEEIPLVFFNREIVTFKARVLGRDPIDRVAAATRVLRELIAQHVTGPVESRRLDGGAMLVSVGGRGVLALTAPDLDPLTGDTLESLTERTEARLRVVLVEDVEARRPAQIVMAVAEALLGLAAGAVLLWLLAFVHRRTVGRLISAAEQRVAKAGFGDAELFRRVRLFEFERRFTAALFVGVALVVIYVVATFVLRRFPFSRPWGDSMRGFLVSTVLDLALSAIRALPNLFIIVLIVVIARFAVRLIRSWFDAIERGRIKVSWIHPETAQPTRRLLTALLWLFTIVMVYPYLPGSQTEAFKGVSVFVGLMVTFGSSGLVNQIVSGFMITFSRALRVGDFVRIGDSEGTVLHIGILSTKLRTLQQEEVTLPNAVVIAQTTTDYSRTGDAEGVFTPVTVTIGYDAPWRQVEALLLMAAERTSGLRREPRPFVLQAALEDFYVRYWLFVCLEQQQSRLYTLNSLHANIQDLFNEYGVQIMSPNYMLDPAAPKVVPKQGWMPAPARPDATRSGV